MIPNPNRKEEVLGTHVDEEEVEGGVMVVVEAVEEVAHTINEKVTMVVKTRVAFNATIVRNTVIMRLNVQTHGKNKTLRTI